MRSIDLGKTKLHANFSPIEKVTDDKAPFDKQQKRAG